MNRFHDKIFFLLLLSTSIVNLHAQGLKELKFSIDGKFIFHETEDNTGKNYKLENLPILSYLANGKLNTTSTRISTLQADSIIFTEGNLQISYKKLSFENGVKARIIFKNISISDTLNIQNVVPFGENPKHVYITGKGDNELSRSYLFRPGYEPANVILPDNAWELGFSAIGFEGGKGICALARRMSWDKERAKRRRFETQLYPGGTVTYALWIDLYNGE